MAKYESDFNIGVFTGIDEVENQNQTSSLLTYGAVSQLIVPLKVVSGTLCPADNAASGTGFGRGAAKIPAGAVIKACYLVIRTAGAASSTVDVGTYKANGTAIDADGLLDGAATSATGLVSTVAGALIGTKVAEDSYIKVTGTASSFTDADIDIVVEFI
jgi:hypothetical protein